MYTVCDRDQKSDDFSIHVTARRVYTSIHRHHAPVPIYTLLLCKSHCEIRSDRRDTHAQNNNILHRLYIYI